MTKPPRIPVRLASPGHYILPIGTTSPTLEADEDTGQLLIQFRLPEKRTIALPVTQALLEDLASLTVGDHPGCSKPDCPVKAKPHQN